MLLHDDDLAVLNLLPVDQSNGEIVRDQLSALCVKFGIPLAILSDCGTDLKKGVHSARLAPIALTRFGKVRYRI